jgi:hypothetical protein
MADQDRQAHAVLLLHEEETWKPGRKRPRDTAECTANAATANDYRIRTCPETSLQPGERGLV